MSAFDEPATSSEASYSNVRTHRSCMCTWRFKY